MKRLLISITLILCFSLSNAQLTHFEVPGYNLFPITGLGNWHVLVEDLNGDGFEDLYITREAQKDLMLYGSSNGAFTAIDITGQPWNNYIGSLDVIAKDLNNDGLKDLIITRIPYKGGNSEALGAKDKILKNLGSGSFIDASTNLPVESFTFGGCNSLETDIDARNYTTGVGIGFFNADTIPDIIMVNGGISYLPSIDLFTPLGIPACKEKLKNDLYFSTGIDGNSDGIDNYTNAPFNFSSPSVYGYVH